MQLPATPRYERRGRLGDDGPPKLFHPASTFLRRLQVDYPPVRRAPLAPGETFGLQLVHESRDVPRRDPHGPSEVLRGTPSGPDEAPEDDESPHGKPSIAQGLAKSRVHREGSTTEVVHQRLL